MESFFLVAQKYRKQTRYDTATQQLAGEVKAELLPLDEAVHSNDYSRAPDTTLDRGTPSSAANKDLMLFNEVDLNDFIDEDKPETVLAETEGNLDTKTQELARAYEELQRRNDEYRRELIVARRVQQTFIPADNDFPKRPELDFAGFYQAMADIGGDLYDVIRIGRNAYGFLIADVSGHGVPAALITALVKVAFRSQLTWGVSPDITCKNVNTELYEIIGEGERYVTAFLAILNLETGMLEFTNAGHHPGQLIRNGELLELNSDGRFLGIFPNPQYNRNATVLEPGDTLVIYTDGIIEAKSYLDEEYGHDRFHEVLVKNYTKNPKELIDAIMADIDSFTMGAPPHDDRAILVIHFNGLDSKLADTVQP